MKADSNGVRCANFGFEKSSRLPKFRWKRKFIIQLEDQSRFHSSGKITVCCQKAFSLMFRWMFRTSHVGAGSLNSSVSRWSVSDARTPGFWFPKLDFTVLKQFEVKSFNVFRELEGALRIRLRLQSFSGRLSLAELDPSLQAPLCKQDLSSFLEFSSLKIQKFWILSLRDLVPADELVNLPRFRRNQFTSLG